MSPASIRALLSAALMFIADRPLVACWCASFPDVAEAVKQADLVFRGKLVKVEFVDSTRSVPHPIFKDRMESVPRRFLATIEVNGAWKGRVGSTIVLHTRESGGDCIGFWKEVGTEVLVFAHEGVFQQKEPDEVVIPEWSDKVAVGQRMIFPDICTLNAEIKDAGATLKKLGPPKRPFVPRP